MMIREIALKIRWKKLMVMVVTVTDDRRVVKGGGIRSGDGRGDRKWMMMMVVIVTDGRRVVRGGVSDDRRGDRKWR